MSEAKLDVHRIVYHRGSVVYARCKTGAPDDYRHPLDVANGLACGCVCDECDEDLQARANDPERIAANEYQKIPHFAHQSNTRCSPSGERGLAEAFRVAIEHMRILKLPEARFSSGKSDSLDCIFRSSEMVRVSSCALQPRLAGNPYELLLDTEKGSFRLLVTVKRLSTSFVEAAKQQPVPVLVAFLTPDLNGSIYMEDVLLTITHARSLSWLWLPDMETAAAEERRRAEDEMERKHREREGREEILRRREEEHQAKTDALRKAEIRKIQETAKGKGLVTMQCSGCHEHTEYAKPPDAYMECPICRRYTFFFPKGEAG